MANRLILDFETKSEVSLNDVGAWLYSRHPSTDAMCIGWSDGFMAGGQWQYGQPPPADLFRDIEQSDVVVAHNSLFELSIWLNVCHLRYGWPAIPFEKWRCSASKAAACSIPRALGKAGEAMRLDVVKDEGEGRQAMLKLSKNKGKDGDFEKMLAYNRTDVDSEAALDEALPDLTPSELAVWQMSERMNLRGFKIDREGCTKAVNLAGEYAWRLTKEFRAITGLETAGQRAKIIVWMSNNGVEVANTQAGTLDDLMTDERLADKPQVRRVCEIVRELGRSSIKKYRSCLDHADTDDRVRGSFLYHGAHTGRYSGRDVQPQNFKRDCPWKMEVAWQHVLEHDLDTLELLYGPPLEFLGSIARGAIVATPGTRFFAGDYAQIEARKVFWFSGERRGLEVFRRGDDMYVAMATTIWGKWLCLARHTKYVKKCVHCDMMRFVGKHAILGLGFGAGYVTFLIHLRELGAPPFDWKMVCDVVPAGWRNATLRWILTEAWPEVKRRIPNATRRDAEELVLTKYIVDKYRAQYKDTVVAYWTTVEDAARNAVQNPGQTFRAGRVSFTCGKRFLNCRLPSGRIMRYLDPQTDGKSVSYIEPVKQMRISSWGGKWVENIVQASSRDIMVERMLALERHEDYRDIILTIHDEVISEVPDGRGDIEEFTAILAEPPDWCGDMPIKVESWTGVRYRKG